MDGIHAAQSSADPKNLLAESQDRTIAVSVYTKSGSRVPYPRTVKEVIRHGNVVGPTTVDPSSMSMPTLLNGRQPGREQPGPKSMVDSS